MNLHYLVVVSGFVRGVYAAKAAAYRLARAIGGAEVFSHHMGVKIGSRVPSDAVRLPHQP